MKTRLSIIPLLITIFLISSCNPTSSGEWPIYDWMPITISFVPVDVDGNNLLENGTLDIDKIKVEAKGQTFGVYSKEALEEFLHKDYSGRDEIKPRPEPNLRAYGPVIFFGATVRKVTVGKSGEQLAIQVGEFSGENEYKNEPIVITWSDGTKDTITFTRYFTNNYLEKTTTVHDKRYLNGKRIDVGTIIIVK